MAGGMIIGPIGRGAADMLSALHGLCFTEAWSPASFDAFLETPGTVALVATREGEPIGFILYRVGADEAEIVTLGVRPDSRLTGAGRALVAAALDAMAAAGARTCFLEVAVDNDAAMALYARAGFRAVGRRPGYYRVGGRAVDAAVMRRDLPAPSVPAS